MDAISLALTLCGIALAFNVYLLYVVRARHAAHLALARRVDSHDDKIGDLARDVAAFAPSSTPPMTASDPAQGTTLARNVSLTRLGQATALAPLARVGTAALARVRIGDAIVIMIPIPEPDALDVDGEPDTTDDHVIITPPPDSGWRLLPPHRPGTRALPVDPREFYPLARKALRRSRHAFTRHEQDDLCQEIVIVATTRGHSYKPGKGTIEQWFSGIARNCVLMYLRARPSEVLWSDVFEGRDLDSVPAPEDDSGELHEAVQRGLASLPKWERTIVARHIIDGKTFREIADELNLGTTTVYGHYTVGVARLRTRVVE